MSIAETAALASGAAEVSAAGASNKKLTDDFSTFLTLLTTQLQNQDPTSPMDSNEFTQQLVQFTGVEQQIQTNQNLEDLAAQLSAASQTNSTNYLGKEALLETNEATLDADGAQWNYSMPTGAIAAAAVIFNEAGDVVFETPANELFGAHELNWDGRNAAGERLPDGSYTMDIVAFDHDNNELKANIQVQDTISAIHYTGSTPLFTVGEHNVHQNEILKLIQGE